MKFLKEKLLNSIIVSIMVFIFLGIAAVYSDSNMGLPPIESLFHKTSITYPYTGTFKQDENTGYFRKKFNLPQDKIFSAVVNIPHCSYDLYVNGKLVYSGAGREGRGASGYWPRGVDVSGYLKPGENVIGINMQAWPYHVYLFGNVIMASGEKIPLVTDKTWKYKKTTTDNWSSSECDDSKWQTVKETKAVLNYCRGQMPAYTGILCLKNPYEEKLFFLDSKEIFFKVHVPSGLEKERPVLWYTINCVDTGKETASGKIILYEKKEISLIYDISAGRMKRGVYTVSLTLKRDDAVLETRDNEVFIVYGKIPQKQVAGDSFEQGMDLTLCDTINCYDPKDPHPYMEGGKGKSRIVKSNGLVYREAGFSRGKWGRVKDEELSREKKKNVYSRTPSDTGFFAYKVKIENPDTPYLIVLEYPDDKNRSIQFQINEFPSDPKYGNVWGYCRESAGAICGGIFPLSHGIKRLPILFFPSREEVMLTVNTQKQGMPAAAGRILIYRVGDIPALRVNKSNQRMFGMYTERAYSFRKMLDGYKMGYSNAPKYAIPEKKQSIWGTYWSPEYFSMWFRTIERFTKYLRFKGENLYIAGCYQYCETNTPYAFSLIHGTTSRLEPDFREILAHVFNENGISLMAGMEIGSKFSIISDLRAQRTDEEVAGGAETIWTVTGKGKQVKGRTFYGWKSTVGNVFHPLVRQAIFDIVDELCQKLASYPSFKGFYFVGLPGWNFAQNPLGGYEDYTINLFEKDTGMKIPVDKTDPKRFEKRYKWLESHADVNNAYVNWKCRKIKEFRMEVVKKIRKYRKDLKIVSRFGHSKLEPFEGGEKEYLDYMKEHYGVDMDLYRNEDALSIARMLARYDNPGKALAYRNFKNRIVVSPTGAFDENHLSNPAYTDKWQWKHLMVFAPAVPADEHYGEEFVGIVAESDPDTIVYGWCDDQIFPGQEQAIRNFAKGFLPLPGNELPLLKGENIDSNILVRAGKVKDRSFFYLINPGWWNSEVEVEIAGVGKRDIIDLTTGFPVECEKAGQENKIKVKLPPYGIKSFVISSQIAGIISVKVQPDNSAAKGLNELICRNEKMVYAQNVRDVLSQEELSFMDNSLKQAGDALKKGNYVEGWGYIANEKFNTILTEKVKILSYIRPWLVIGPFPNNEDFLKKEDENITIGVSKGVKDENSKGFHIEFEVEKDILAQGIPGRDKNYTGADGKSVKWRETITTMKNERSFLDLSSLFTPCNWTVGYAWTRVYSDINQKVRLLAGTDDGGKIWLNGKLVINVLKARAPRWGEDKAEVTLRKGVNWVLVKEENRRGGFGFYLDFVDKENNVLNNIRYSTK